MFNLTDKQTVLFRTVADQIRRANAPFLPRWVVPGDTREDSTSRLMLNGLASKKVLVLHEVPKIGQVYTITPAAIADWKQQKRVEAEQRAGEMLWAALMDGGLYIPAYVRSCRQRIGSRHAGVRPLNRKAGICLFSEFEFRNHVAVENIAIEGKDALLKRMADFMPLAHWTIEAGNSQAGM